LRIEITSTGLVLTKARSGKLRRRVLLDLGRFGREVHGLTVQLGRSRNPLGGVDQRCRVRARLQSGRVLCVESIGGKIDAAVSRSAARLALLVAAALDDVATHRRPAPALGHRGSLE